MKTKGVILLVLSITYVCFFPPALSVADSPASLLYAGFAETDITPALGKKPVFMAGFGQGREQRLKRQRIGRCRRFECRGHRLKLTG